MSDLREEGASAYGTNKSSEALRKLWVIVQSFKVARPMFVYKKCHLGGVVGGIGDLLVS